MGTKSKQKKNKVFRGIKTDIGSKHLAEALTHFKGGKIKQRTKQMEYNSSFPYSERWTKKKKCSQTESENHLLLNYSNNNQTTKNTHKHNYTKNTNSWVTIEKSQLVFGEKY